jgi:uncharacterized membrane protein YhaH (DUF805 family)
MIAIIRLYLESYLKKWSDCYTSVSRRDFWLTQVCVLLATIVLGLILFGICSGISFAGNTLDIPVVAGIIPSVLMVMGAIVLSVVNLFCGVALLCRRFNDIGINIWWVATILIPGFGFIPYLIALLPRGGIKIF